MTPFLDTISDTISCALIESAKANNIEPLAYLEHIFKEQLSKCAKLEDYEALPWNLKTVLSNFK